MKEQHGKKHTASGDSVLLTGRDESEREESAERGRTEKASARRSPRSQEKKPSKPGRGRNYERKRNFSDVVHEGLNDVMALTRALYDCWKEKRANGGRRGGRKVGEKVFSLVFRCEFYRRHRRHDFWLLFSGAQ
jgi:hypothetical protein